MHIRSVVLKVRCNRSSWRQDVGWLLTSSSSSLSQPSTVIFLWVDEGRSPSSGSALCRDVAQFAVGNHAPLLLEVAIATLELQPRLRGPMRGHVSIFQLAPVAQDLQGSLCRARMARRAVTLVAPPDQVCCHPYCLQEAHRREGRGLGVESILSILELQVPGTIVPSRRRGVPPGLPP